MGLLLWRWTGCNQRENQKVEKASQRTKMDPKEENQKESPKARTTKAKENPMTRKVTKEVEVSDPRAKGRMIRKHATYVGNPGILLVTVGRHLKGHKFDKWVQKLAKLQHQLLRQMVE